MNKNELIFNIHKEDIIEDTIKYKQKLKQKYNISEDEVHNLFAKVINYQIDKYGYQKSKYEEDITRDTFYHKTRKATQRKYAKVRRTR